MFEEIIENITKSDSLFAPTFVNDYILPHVNFDGHCLLNNNISIPKKVCFLHTKSIVMRFKHGFYIK